MWLQPVERWMAAPQPGHFWVFSSTQSSAPASPFCRAAASRRAHSAAAAQDAGSCGGWPQEKQNSAPHSQATSKARPWRSASAAQSRPRSGARTVTGRPQPGAGHHLTLSFTSTNRAAASWRNLCSRCGGSSARSATSGTTAVQSGTGQRSRVVFPSESRASTYDTQQSLQATCSQPAPRNGRSSPSSSQHTTQTRGFETVGEAGLVPPSFSCASPPSPSRPPNLSPPPLTSPASPPSPPASTPSPPPSIPLPSPMEFFLASWGAPSRPSPPFSRGPSSPEQGESPPIAAECRRTTSPTSHRASSSRAWAAGGARPQAAATLAMAPPRISCTSPAPPRV